MPTNLQSMIERQRAIYETLAKPLLSQLASLHRLTIRDFAAVFGISRNHAEAILKHRVVPSLELAFRIARYYEVHVDELFGWMFDDTGERRPLIVESKGIIGQLKSSESSLAVVEAELE